MRAKLILALFFFQFLFVPVLLTQSARGCATAQPRFSDYKIESLYIPMRDGVKIAIDVVLPEGLPAGEKIPTILNQTRYWRNIELRKKTGDPKQLDQNRELKLFFASQGYGMVFADVRGTGASFGVNPHPWSRDEIRDGSEIVDWIIAQPWSNGKVGALGISYEGTTAQLLVVPNHPAVKAVVPIAIEYDVYNEIAFPGGVFNDWFVQVWGHGNYLRDRNELCDDDGSECLQLRQFIRGVKPVDADKNRKHLKRAVRQHRANTDVYEAARKLTFRDEHSPDFNSTIDGFSVHSFKQEIEQSNVAIFGWGSWMDGATAEGVIRRLLTLPNPQKAIIGPWNHGATEHASPYLPPNTPVAPSIPEQLALVLRFFDFHLKDIDNGVMSEPALTYYTLGEEKWKTTNVWPPEGSTTRRWYLAEGGRLSMSAPTGSTDEETYRIDFDASTGELNRWRTQALGSDVVYANRAQEDRRLLTYTSEPLDQDMEITGHPTITLYVTSTHTDGAFFVYLEDVDENGNVTYVTEGELRAIHRKVSIEQAPYRSLSPYHSFKQRDAMPLVPGEAAELSFGLNPTSVLIKRGHRIRIAVAGHDRSTFARIPSEGTPTIKIASNSARSSFIDLPVIPKN